MRTLEVVGIVLFLFFLFMVLFCPGWRMSFRFWKRRVFSCIRYLGILHQNGFKMGTGKWAREQEIEEFEVLCCILIRGGG
jgi:hypothetical protein